jgi:hypothetical protein
LPLQLIAKGNVLALHFFEIFEKQDRIEGVKPLAIHPVDDFTLPDHALFSVDYESSGFAKVFQRYDQVHTQSSPATCRNSKGM